MKIPRRLPARILAFVLAAVLAALLAASLTACGVTLEPGENGLYDKENKISYSHASTVYEATALKDEYGKLAVTDKESYALYTIPGVDGTDMLATEDFNILYSNRVTMPTLTDMAPSVLHICTDASGTVRELARLENAEEIAALVTAYEEGESLDYPARTPRLTYTVRFESVKYPGFYYTLTYVEYGEELVTDDGTNYGQYFLYSAFDQRFVPVSDAIHAALGQS